MICMLCIANDGFLLSVYEDISFITFKGKLGLAQLHWDTCFQPYKLTQNLLSYN